jgi:hypothetical protein
MSINERIDRILAQKTLAVSKELYSLERIVFVSGEVPSETSDAWLVSCKHELAPPATISEIRDAEQALGIQFPTELVAFLLRTNGANFYIVPRVWLHDVNPNAQHVRYRILCTNEIVQMTKWCLNLFRNYAETDSEYHDVMSLNYLVFCDAHNDNYLAMLLEEAHEGTIFFLDHEYNCYPYDQYTAIPYKKVADSLEAWLKLLIESQGWRGFGEEEPAL